MECPCLVHPPFTSVALGAKAADHTGQPNQPSRLFPKPSVTCTPGVINPSYEMRLYTVRICDGTSGKLFPATWTSLYLRKRRWTLPPRTRRNENVSDFVRAPRCLLADRRLQNNVDNGNKLNTVNFSD